MSARGHMLRALLSRLQVGGRGAGRRGEPALPQDAFEGRDSEGVVLAHLDPARVLYANAAAARLVGRTAEELLALPPAGLEDLVHPDDRDGLLECLDRALRQAPIVEHVFRAVAGDGSALWLSGRFSAAPHAERPAVLITLVDATGRMAAQRRAEHLNAVLRAVRNVNQLILRETDPGRLVERACALLAEGGAYLGAWLAILDAEGHVAAAGSAGEGGAQPRTEGVRGAELPPCLRVPAEQDERLRAVPEEWCRACPHAEDRADRAVLRAHLSPGDQGAGFLAVAVPPEMVDDPEERALLREVADDLASALRALRLEENRGEAARRLDESERRLETLLDNLPGMAYRCAVDEHRTMEFVSGGCRDLTGYAPEDLVGNSRTTYAELIHPEDRRRVMREVEGAVAAGVPFALSYRLITATGEEYSVWERGRAVSDGEGGARAVEGLVLDVTEMHRAEEELRSSEARYRQLYNAVTDAILVVDEDTLEILDCNETAVARYGYAYEELCGMTLAQLEVPGTGQPAARASAERPRGAPTHTRHVTRQGRAFPVETDCAAIEYLGRRASLLLVRDVTEGARALAEIERLARFPAENPHPVLRVRADGTILYANAASRPILESWERTIGQRVPDAAAREVHEALERRAMHDVDLTLGDGHYHLTFVPVAAAGYVNIYGIDTTRSRALEEQLRQAQKMEAVGQLAGGIAHDFNNLLTVIEGYSAFVLDELGDDDSIRGDIEEIREAGARAATLTQQLLAFSRRQLVEPEIIDLNAVLQGMANMLGRLIGEDITVEMRLVDDLYTVLADRGQIEEVVVNLAVNARDAMPGGGRLTIETANVTLDASRVRSFADARPGPYAMLSVRDTGIGMSREVQAHLFEPFFTTKPRGKGTGLGLAQIYGIVRGSGGLIEVESATGQGSTFRVFLPLAEEGPPSREEAPDVPLAEIRGGSETVLVVEDQERVRGVATRMLRSLGYTALEASDGYEALRLFRDAKHSRIDLVLTDVVMPGVSGRELVDALRRIRPNVRVVYMSGHTEDAIHDRGALHADVRLVRKPFSLQNLGEVVRAALDAPSDPTGLRDAAEPGAPGAGR